VKRSAARLRCYCFVSLATLCAATKAMAQTADDLALMSIEDLGKIEITSVSKKAQPLDEAAAAVFVITRDDIRRSGARSIPEILRLAPNLQVARVDASQYAISARGFNSTTANKLLVLIDGRSVYTPLYSGVFWDVPDEMPENIERIEVISGPGGTLWGANAVNGVINIITRDAQQTRGSLLSVVAGQAERSVSARHGGQFGAQGAYRLTARGLARPDTATAAGVDQQDSWYRKDLGFHANWRQHGDALMLDMNLYRGVLDQKVNADKRISGSHAVGRWTRALADGATLQVQAYADHSKRDYPGTYAESRQTYDVEMQHRFGRRAGHELVWGAGYRLSRDDVINSAALAFVPAQRSMVQVNVFLQDSIALSDALELVLGVKSEHNSYTGIEWQPNARLAWKRADGSLLWTALSRAVRTPSRVDTDLYSPGKPPYTVLAGGPGFRSEHVDAAEAGYRVSPVTHATLSVSVYYNVFHDLRSLEGVRPITLANMLEGKAHGLEMWGDYRVSDWWRLSAGYNYMKKHLHLDAGSRDTTSLKLDADPRHQFLLRSLMRAGQDLEVDTTLRAVGALPATSTQPNSNSRVPGYAALDVRVGWNVSRQLELSLVAQNLLNQRHAQFGAAATRTGFGRALSLVMLWKP
jgi:iron complex outermembrane receptor protein